MGLKDLAKGAAKEVANEYFKGIKTKVKIVLIGIVVFLIIIVSLFGDADNVGGSTNGNYNSAGNGNISYVSLNLTDEDKEILYKITSAERGEGTQQQQEYVACVVLNRVLSSDFPNTVYDVVFAPQQFQPTRNGAYEAANPSDITIAAVDNVIRNGDTTGGAVYFMTPAAAEGQQSWLCNCVFLFNDVGANEDGGEYADSSHNFYTKQTVLDELEQYCSGRGTGSYSTSALAEVANKSVNEKLAYLFPNGTPTTPDEASQYMKTINVPMTTKDGVKYTGQLTVHQALEQDIIDVFQSAQNAGFKIYDASAYSFRTMNNGGAGTVSHHSYGIAIDINVVENYSHRGSTVYAGEFWNPSTSEYSIPRNGVLVNAFKAKGWGWGGDWSGDYQDYMHFSFTGY